MHGKKILKVFEFLFSIANDRKGGRKNYAYDFLFFVLSVSIAPTTKTIFIREASKLKGSFFKSMTSIEKAITDCHLLFSKDKDTRDNCNITSIIPTILFIPSHTSIV